MQRTAHLFTRVIVDEIEVEVDYDFGGTDLKITCQRALTENPAKYDTYAFDDAVWEAVCEECDEAYAEWLADLGDWQYEQASDRAMENAL
jgi:hypothetical protein